MSQTPPLAMLVARIFRDFAPQKDDNEFEKTFARFLDTAGDVKAFSKLPEVFGLAIDYTHDGNLRSYYPDFVAVDKDGSFWILETKGQETGEVKYKDRAATLWCENASTLTGKTWQYLKIPQKEFERLRPEAFRELMALKINYLV